MRSQSKYEWQPSTAFALDRSQARIMSQVRLVNVRVDDRLLHGQVLYNWLRHLEPDCVIIVSASITEVQRELLRAALPARYELWLGNSRQAAEYLATLDVVPITALLLVPDVWQLLELVHEWIVLPIVTLGSQGWRPGRSRLTPQIALDTREVEVLESLALNGLEIVYQALPSNVAVPWARLHPGRG
ncbi:MAG: PTS sugar transporter subunit IIB [Anaerolineae bacterium]